MYFLLIGRYWFQTYKTISSSSRRREDGEIDTKTPYFLRNTAVFWIAEIFVYDINWLNFVLTHKVKYLLSANVKFETLRFQAKLNPPLACEAHLTAEANLAVLCTI